MWSWLMPQTENLMEYFGLASASWPGSAISWTTGPPPGWSPNAASGIAANIPAELIVLRNERRFRPSFCICLAPYSCWYRVVRRSSYRLASGLQRINCDTELYCYFITNNLVTGNVFGKCNILAPIRERASSVGERAVRVPFFAKLMSNG